MNLHPCYHRDHSAMQYVLVVTKKADAVSKQQHRMERPVTLAPFEWVESCSQPAPPVYLLQLLLSAGIRGASWAPQPKAQACVATMRQRQEWMPLSMDGWSSIPSQMAQVGHPSSFAKNCLTPVGSMQTKACVLPVS